MQETTLYYNCKNGITAQANVAALSYLASSDYDLCSAIKELVIPDFNIKIVQEAQNARSLFIDTDSKDKDRYLNDIKALIEKSPLRQRIKALIISVFGCLADALAKTQQVSATEAQFGELGSNEAIISVAASVMSIENLKPDFIISTKVAIPEHASKLLNELLTDIPTVIVKDAITDPLGAALISSIVDKFGDINENLENKGAAILDNSSLLHVYFDSKEKTF